MPNRTILNRCGLFVTQVRKISRKKDIENSDIQTVNKARLVAALSSNHSWRISRYLYNSDILDPAATAAELFAAFKVSWKYIDENDIMEVVNSDIEEHKLCNVLMCAHDRTMMKVFRDLFPELKNEFANGMEPIMREEV